MRFTIRTERRNGIDFLILKNEILGEYAEIIPGIGATVHALYVTVGSSVQNILYNDTHQELIENPLFRGRILFPFNDIIPGGQYPFNNTMYTLDVNMPKVNSAIHGYVYNKQFEIVSQACADDSCSVTLQYALAKDRMKGYPFSLTLTVTYVLKAQEFVVRFAVTNNGTAVAPLSFGWHPYFTFNGSLDRARLTMDAAYYLETDADHVPTNRFLDCSGTPFDFSAGRDIADLEIDNAFTAPADGCSRLRRQGSTIILFQDTNIFKYVQLYSPDDHKSIAIEPVTAGANAFNNPELGLMTLEPNECIDTFAAVRVE